MRLVINIYRSKWWEMTRKEACWVDLKIQKSPEMVQAGRGKAAALVCSKKLASVANARAIQDRSSGRACVCTGGRRDLEAISMFIAFISQRLAWFGLHWAGKSERAQKSSAWTSNLFRKFMKELEMEAFSIQPTRQLWKETQRERKMSGKMGASPPGLGRAHEAVATTEPAHRLPRERKHLWL